MLLFLLTVGSILLNAWLLGLYVRRKQPAQVNQVAFAPVSPSSDLVVRGSTFTLAGDNWSWIGDTPASYGCLLCGCWQDVDMRQYKHSSGQVFAVLSHQCGQGQPEPITEAIELKKGAAE